MRHWIVGWVVAALVLNGFAVAAQRVGPRAHVHLTPIAVAQFDQDDDDDDAGHDHHDADAHRHDAAPSHFHALPGHHEHGAHDRGVLFVDDGDHGTSGKDARDFARRVALDQEQLPSPATPQQATAHAAVPVTPPARLLRSHLAEPVDPPPRHAA